MPSNLLELAVPNLAYLVAFAVASIVVVTELLSSEYPRTYFVLANSKSLALYAALYGLLAVIALLLFATLIDARLSTGTTLISPWVKAAIFGAAIKSVLQLNVVTIRIGSERIPLGLKTIVQVFEPQLLRNIAFHEFLHVRALVNKVGSVDAPLGDVKRDAIEGVPSSLPEPERAAFSADVQAAASAERVMTLYLRFAGRDAFERVFVAPKRRVA